MAIENGFFLQTNDDGSTTIFQCKHYSCYEEMIQDTTPPHYGICEDTRIRYTFDPVNGWEELVGVKYVTDISVDPSMYDMDPPVEETPDSKIVEKRISVLPGLYTCGCALILTNRVFTTIDCNGNIPVCKHISSPDWLPENIAEGKSIFGVQGAANLSPFSVYKVNQYTPYRAELTAISEFTLSGCYKVGYDEEYAYSIEALNGTYRVTEDTKYNEPLNRVYKQVDGTRYMAYYKAQDDDYFGSHWFISTSLSNHGWNADIILQTEDFVNPGNTKWYNDGYGNAINTEPTVENVINTTYPEQPLVLTGNKLESYNSDTRMPTYGSTAVSLYDANVVDPMVTGVFLTMANTLCAQIDLPDDTFMTSGTLFALDANIGINDLVAGTEPSLIGNGEVLQNGEFCFDNTRAFAYVIGESMSALDEFTIEMDYTVTSNTTGYCGFVGNKNSWSTMCVCIQWGRSGYRPAMFWNDYFDTTTGGAEHSEWVNDGVYHHVAMVRKGDTITLYSDGEAIAKYEGATKNLNLAIENTLAVGTQLVEDQIFPGRMKHFRIVNRAVYTKDFNIPTWVGEGSGSDNAEG